jgi:hypothetical protein
MATLTQIPVLPLPASAQTATPPRRTLLLGALLCFAIVAATGAGFLPFSTLDLALSGAFCVLVPSVLMLAGAGQGRLARRHLVWLSNAYPVALVAAVIAQQLPPGALATALSIVWLLFAAGLAWFGVVRFFERDDRLCAEELCIDAGLAYALVGAFAFFTACADLPFLGFFQPFPTLTAMHFHYAGMFVPVLTGLCGRALAGHRRVFSWVAAGVIFGSALVGIGILASQVLETLAVLVLSFALCGLSVLVLLDLVPRVRAQWLRIALIATALAPFVSMPLALLYSAGELFEQPWITIPGMIATHGRINAIGIGLLGVLSWLALRPAARAAPHRDARTLAALRDVPVNYAPAQGEAGLTVHEFTTDLGHDPSGVVFARAAERVLRYRFYPQHIISSVSDFSLAERDARVGDRIVLRLHLLHLFGLPLLHMRALVEVNAVEDSPRRKRLSYCTTDWHIACGGCAATLLWRDDDHVIMTLRSVERPLLGLLKLPFITPLFRAFLDRALRSVGER